MRQLQNATTMFKRNRSFAWFVLCICFVLNYSCQDGTLPVESEFVDVKPAYSDIKLALKDTVNFALGKDTYNRVKSFNYFTAKNGKEYISFYDRRSESVVIYDFVTHFQVGKMPLSKVIKGRRLFKTSVYVHNFDSIYLTNYDKLYLMDTSGKVHRQYTFDNMESIGVYETSLPLVIKGKEVFMGFRPFVSEKSLAEIKRWRILGAFNLDRDECNHHYYLPAVYREGLYGRRFMDFSFCYNDKNNFVFSFPADSNVYETNLTDYHMSYAGNSKFQNGPIESVGKQALEKKEGNKEYRLRDSYGAIYFDPYKKRYLRIAKQAVGLDSLASARRKTTVIVMDQHFRIIGEFETHNEFLLNTIFFTANGSMYAQVNNADENALHFVRLTWENDADESSNLTKK